MGFDRRTATLTVPNPAATVVQTFNLRSTYVRPNNFSILSTGTDATQKLRLTDADGRIFYLDAADKDYDTARIYTPLLLDDVNTGLTSAGGVGTFLGSDSVGVEVAVAQSGAMPVVKSPLEIAVINGGTAGDVIDFTFDYEYGCFGATTFVLPTAASSTATKTMSLRSKFAQILGFRAKSVGTSTTQIMEIKDADGKIVYLDAAAADYDTAEIDKVLNLDATVTGLTQVVPRGSTGAAVQAGVGRVDLPIVRSPITFTVTASEGNDEVVTAVVYYKTG